MADKGLDSATEKMANHSDTDSAASRPERLDTVENGADVEKSSSHANERSKAASSPAQRIQTAQDWTGPDDPGNPLNWSVSKKIYHTLIPAFQCFTITFGSSVYTPGIHSVQSDFNVSLESSILPLSLYVLGLGFGPVISAPLSETFGRRAVYLTVFPPSLLFTLGAGLAQNFPTLLICRFLAGTLGSGCLAVGAGTNSDLYSPISRAAASSIFLLAPFLGPALGPPVGGFAAQYKDWRWTQWPILFIGAFTYLLTIPSKETYKKIILQSRAQTLNLPPPPNPLPPGFARIKFLLVVTVFRPIRMLCTEPIVAFLSIYTAFNFSVLFGFFDAFPLVFEGAHSIYHFTTSQTGLVFLGLGLGCTLATLLFILLDRAIYRKKTLVRRLIHGDHTPLPPEQRLQPAMLGSLLLPISLFWFAWTARRDVHWISPVLATIPFGAGNLLVFCSTILYLIDTYGPLLGASAAAANGVLRYLCGAAFPLFTVQMYRSMGVGWATSFFAWVTLALLPIPWILFKYGHAIRARSGYETTK